MAFWVDKTSSVSIHAKHLPKGGVAGGSTGRHLELSCSECHRDRPRFGLYAADQPRVPMRLVPRHTRHFCRQRAHQRDHSCRKTIVPTVSVAQVPCETHRVFTSNYVKVQPAATTPSDDVPRSKYQGRARLVGATMARVARTWLPRPRNGSSTHSSTAARYCHNKNSGLKVWRRLGKSNDAKIPARWLKHCTFRHDRHTLLAALEFTRML